MNVKESVIHERYTSFVNRYTKTCTNDVRDAATDVLRYDAYRVYVSSVYERVNTDINMTTLYIPALQFKDFVTELTNDYDISSKCSFSEQPKDISLLRFDIDLYCKQTRGRGKGIEICGFDMDDVWNRASTSNNENVIHNQTTDISSQREHRHRLYTNGLIEEICENIYQSTIHFFREEVNIQRNVSINVYTRSKEYFGLDQPSTRDGLHITMPNIYITTTYYKEYIRYLQYLLTKITTCRKWNIEIQVDDIIRKPWYYSCRKNKTQYKYFVTYNKPINNESDVFTLIQNEGKVIDVNGIKWKQGTLEFIHPPTISRDYTKVLSTTFVIGHYVYAMTTMSVGCSNMEGVVRSGSSSDRDAQTSQKSYMIRITLDSINYLRHIKPQTYYIWIWIGRLMKRLGYTLNNWEEWSKMCPEQYSKNTPQLMMKLWHKFDRECFNDEITKLLFNSRLLPSKATRCALYREYVITYTRLYGRSGIGIKYTKSDCKTTPIHFFMGLKMYIEQRIIYEDDEKVFYVYNYDPSNIYTPYAVTYPSHTWVSVTDETIKRIILQDKNLLEIQTLRNVTDIGKIITICTQFKRLLNKEMDELAFNNGQYHLRKNDFQYNLPCTIRMIDTCIEHDYNPYWLRDKALRYIGYTYLSTVLSADKTVIHRFLHIIRRCLYGGNIDRMFYIIIGNTTIGKSTLINILDIAFGNYVGSLPFNFCSLMGGKADKRYADGSIKSFKEQQRNSTQQHFGKHSSASVKGTPELVKIKNCRLVTVVDIPTTVPLDWVNLKSLTGYDKQTIRDNYATAKQTTSEEVLYTLLLICNEFPDCSGADTPFWKRIATYVSDVSPILTPILFTFDMKRKLAYIIRHMVLGVASLEYIHSIEGERVSDQQQSSEGCWDELLQRYEIPTIPIYDDFVEEENLETGNDDIVLKQAAKAYETQFQSHLKYLKNSTEEFRKKRCKVYKFLSECYEETDTEEYSVPDLCVDYVEYCGTSVNSGELQEVIEAFKSVLSNYHVIKYDYVKLKKKVS